MVKILLILLGMLVLSSCEKTETDEEVQQKMYFPPNDGAWETITPESLGWNTSALSELKKLLDDNGTRAFIILKDGKIVEEEYFGKDILGLASFSRNSNWYWASAGKTLTSFMVGKAQQDGLLNIQDKTSDYLGVGWTSLTPGQEASITIRHQLTMTTGLDDGIADSHGTQPRDLVYKSAAGTRWAYHNGPYTLLEQVVSNAVDQDFDTYFRINLRNQTGMDGFWQWVDQDHVYFSTARSMARFGLLILNQGMWDGNEILKDKTYFHEMVNTSQELNKSYGYLWWLNGKESFMIPETQRVFKGSYAPHAPDDMIAGIGKNGQYVCVVPSQKLVMVRMGENPESVPVPFLFLDDIWEKLNVIIQ